MNKVATARADGYSLHSPGTNLPRLFKAVRNLHRVSEVRQARGVTANWIKLTTSYVGLPVKLPFSIRLRTGRFTFNTLADVRTFWSVFFAGTYAVMPTDRLIVDAGANIGTFTLYALLSAPNARVIAIEPAPDCCKLLRKLIEEHGFTARCQIYEAALGDHHGISHINLSCESQFREIGRGGTEVAVIPLDHAVGNVQIDLLKMDIEGGEYAVLASSPNCLKRTERVALEYHSNKRPAALVETLKALGLSCDSLREDGGGYGIAQFRRRPTGHRGTSLAAVN